MPEILHQIALGEALDSFQGPADGATEEEVSGRAEATFSDGSAVILHPPTATKATFFSSDGRRQRLVSQCSPQGGADLRGKIMAAAAVRDRFHPHPSSLQPAELCQRSYGSYAKLSRVAWPSQAEEREDGSIEVSSLDGSAQLLLAPHGRTFAVEWLRPLGSSVLELQKTPSDGSVEQWPCPRLFQSEGRAANLLHDCVRQVQCFPVDECVEVAWMFPLLMALLQHETCNERVALIRSLAEALRQCMDSGRVLESGSCVTALLPQFEQLEEVAVSNDEISPAACSGCMGSCAEGPAMLLWTPQSVIRLSRKEASVEAWDDTEGKSQWAFLESSLGGRFWKLASSNVEWQLPDCLCADLLPPGDSVLTCRLLSLVQEAAGWLQHNASEECSLGVLPSKGYQNIEGGHAKGWLREAEVEDESARLTAFRCNERVLVRVLFTDGRRMEFEVQAVQADLSQLAHLELVRLPGEFRLVTGRGELRRRFAEPLGAEEEVQQAARLLRKLRSLPSPAKAAAASQAALAAQAAQAALRRTQLCLLGARVERVV